MALQNVHSFSMELDNYYDRVSEFAIDERIRKSIVDVANKLADEIIAQYSVKKLIRMRLKDEKTLKDKMIIALEVERENK